MLRIRAKSLNRIHTWRPKFLPITKPRMIWPEGVILWSEQESCLRQCPFMAFLCGPFAPFLSLSGHTDWGGEYKWLKSFHLLLFSFSCCNILFYLLLLISLAWFYTYKTQQEKFIVCIWPLLLLVFWLLLKKILFVEEGWYCEIICPR